MRILIAVIAMLLLMQSIALAQETTNTRPNILFIVSNDHGWGDLPSNWDKTEVRLPTLDALAARGVRFSNYHTAPPLNTGQTRLRFSFNF